MPETGLSFWCSLRYAKLCIGSLLPCNLWSILLTSSLLHVVLIVCTLPSVLQDVVREVLTFAEVNSGSSTPDQSTARQDHRPPLSPLQRSLDGTYSPLMYVYGLMFLFIRLLFSQSARQA